MSSRSTTRIFVPPSHGRLSLVLRRLSDWGLLILVTALGSLAFVAACLLLQHIYQTTSL